MGNDSRRIRCHDFWNRAVAFTGSLGAGLVAALVTIVAAQASADEPSVDYAKQIKPLLRDRCYACHGALKQEAGLRLDTAALVRRGGSEGPVIVSGPPASGKLLERVASGDGEQRMPPEGQPLTAEQLDLLRAWIARGALGPKDESSEQDPREHWAFRLPRRAPLPDVHAPAFAANPIDRFVLARLDASRLAPRRAARPELLLRRVYLDLIGIPPTADELQEFLAEPTDEAYQHVVERLLASPLHGERWGRHWMDVWRYSDWYGRRHVPDVWNSAPQVWRWRDWIVDSLNHDAGYDRMIKSMLAADEVYPGDDQAAVATAYLIRNWFALNPNHWMRENVEHTAKAFLGLTFNCAHCHDHKYDPISQKDYFRFRAFFEPLGIRQDRVPGEADPGKFQEYEYSVLRKIQRLGMVSVYDKSPEAPTWLYTGGDERNRAKDQGSIAPVVPSVLGGPPLLIAPLELPPLAWNPGLRPAIQETELAQLRVLLTRAEQQAAAAEVEHKRVSPDLAREVAAAEMAFATAVEQAKAQGATTALAGQQSLLLQALAGRRCLTQSLTELRSLPSQTAVRFQLRIVRDSHVNFQFAKDIVKGLTAGMVAFDTGRIVSYRPGGFTEFDVGKYDFAAGENWFDVEFVLDTTADHCRLSVRDHRQGKVLVDHVPVALNGWNPVGDPTKAVSFDARTGSVAAVDEFEVLVPTPAAQPGPAGSEPRRAVYFDFEAPRFVEGEDVAGIDGWAASSFGAAPATSTITALIDAPGLDEAQQKRTAARQALSLAELNFQAAQVALAAAAKQLAATAARIQADRARYAAPVDPAAPELIRAAIALEREAALATAEATLVSRRHDLAAAERLPVADANRAKSVQAVTPRIAEALAALDKLRAQSLPDDYAPLGPTYGKASSGRRRALAEWIASRQNPLTARVAVNHVWMRHFGTPLVATVFDFGRNGSPPSHPELLDVLALELLESGWSMKHLHRLIVTSAVYRQASGSREPAAFANQAEPVDSGSVDPENRLLWRMNARRMDAEVVRDSLLYVSDQLDLRPRGQELENTEALTTRRRSLYYSCHPELGGKSDLSMLFDGADAADCYRRSASVTPQQALALTNSQLVHDLSGALAAQLEALAQQRAAAAVRTDAGGTEAAVRDPAGAFVELAYLRILSRGPTTDERQLCIDFLNKQAAVVAKTQPAEASARARESLVRALLNNNDFVTIR